MGLIAERHKGSLEYNRNVRLMRLLRLYEESVSVKEIARMEKVTPTRIYQLLNEALAKRQSGINGT